MNFNYMFCKNPGGVGKEGCPVTFANGATGFVYLTVITYDPSLIPNLGQMATVDLGYKITPGGSLIECYGATVPGPAYGGGKGKCESGSPADNDVGGVVTFPKNSTDIYLFTGDMDENFVNKGGFGDQPSYVEYNTLYSELGITVSS